MGDKSILLLSGGGDHPLGEAAQRLPYSEAARSVSAHTVLWVDLSEGAPCLGTEGLTALVQASRLGTGLVVSGTLGSSSIAESALGDLLPVASLGDRDVYPSWSPADVNATGLAHWPGSGHVRAESPDHPVAADLAQEDHARVPRAIACEIRPGAHVVARYLSMPSLGVAERPIPTPWPFVAEWSPLGGRVIYVATGLADLCATTPDLDGPALCRSLIDRAQQRPDSSEVAQCRALYLQGRLWQCRERVGVLGLELAGRLAEALAPPERALSDAERAVRGQVPEAALRALDNVARLVNALEGQIAEAEAEQYRAAVAAHDRFHHLVAELELAGSADPWEIVRVEAQGSAGHRALAMGHATDALKRYRGLCEALEHRLWRRGGAA